MAEEEQSSPPEFTDEERETQRRRADIDVARLTRYGVWLSVTGVGLSAVLAALGVSGAGTFSRGLLLGCLVSLLNLRVIARAGWAMLVDRDVPRALLGVTASFSLLMGAAVFLVLSHPDLLLGFGFGLALPAAAGVWFGLTLRPEESE
ncbi:MAG: hypothetical protein ACO3JL_13595 [Myxococcota bacterium]